MILEYTNRKRVLLFFNNSTILWYNPNLIKDLQEKHNLECLNDTRLDNHIFIFNDIYMN